MSDAKIDTPELLTILRDIVAEQGADTTSECVYRDSATGEPHCIAAQAIFKIGGHDALDELVEDEIIGVLVELGDEFTVQEKESRNQDFSLTLMTPQALKTLRVAQFVQDSQGEWGEALKLAEHYAETGRVDTDE